jgi:starch synthase
MRIAHISPEAAPFVKVGGLGDVASALPRAQAQDGHDVTLVLPGYSRVWSRLETTGTRFPVSYRLDGREIVGAAVEGRYEGVRVLAIDHQGFFGRDGVYGDVSGSYGDNGERYAWFSGAALSALRALSPPPEVIQLHDWPSALAASMLRAHSGAQDPLGRAASVLVIHNLAHQGVFPLELGRRLALPDVFLDQNGLEALGNLNMLKGGIYHSTAVATVSPTYAREIVWPAFGEGLERALQARGDDLVGILNGLDVNAWDPMSDDALAAPYGPNALSGKTVCKSALQKELGLRVDPAIPVFGMVSRIDRQKGVQLVEHVAPWLVEQGAQVVVLGSGTRSLIDPLHGLASMWRESVAVIEAFDEGLARRIYAGSDFFLMPSLFEPCGLGQMVALRYGTPPIARRTGGLADTVRDELESETANGFLFNHPDPFGLGWACGRALDLFRQNPARVETLRARGMSEDLSWSRSAKEYERLLDRAREKESRRVLAL